MSDDLQLDWAAIPKLLPVCLEFADKKRNKESIDLREAVNRIGGALGIEDVDQFSADRFQAFLADGLGGAFDDANANAIAAVFAKNSKPLMTAFASFAHGDMNVAALKRTMDELCLGSTGELQAILQKSLHIPDELASVISDKLGPYTVTVYCFAAAFKIYAAAAADAKAAKERRIEAERLANEAIAKLKAERAEMDKILSDWMLDRIIPFSEGVQAMDRAILDDDDDAYITANADLWKLLGREAAYSNASEFDDLMLSDDAFKL